MKIHCPLGARIETPENALVAVASRWWASAAADGCRTPPAPETGTGAVGLAVGMPPGAAVVGRTDELTSEPAAADTALLNTSLLDVTLLDAAGRLLTSALGTATAVWVVPVALAVFVFPRLVVLVRLLVAVSPLVDDVATTSAGEDVTAPAVEDTTASGRVDTATAVVSLGTTESAALLLGAAAPRSFPSTTVVGNAAGEVLVIFLTFWPRNLAPKAPNVLFASITGAVIVRVR